MLVLVTIIVGILAWFFIYGKKARELPNGVNGWPFVGSLPHQKTHLSTQIGEYRKQFGDIFSWRLGHQDVVFLCKFDIVKEAYANPLIANRPEFHSFLSVSYDKSIGLANSNGESWQNIRRFAIRLLRDRGMGKSSLEPQIDHEVAYVVDDFKLHTNEHSELPWSLNIGVLNVSWRIVADVRYNVQDETMQEFQKLMRQLFVDLQGYVQLYDYYPFLLKVLPSFANRFLGIQKFYDNAATMQRFMEKVIDVYEELDDSHKQENFIGAYLTEMQNRENGKHSDYANTFSYQDLAAALLDLFAASSETTSTTIRWIMIYMAKYSEIQKKAQKEIDSVCSRDKRPCLDDRPNLPYTNAIIHEVMRCRPVLPVGLYHYASADTTIGDQTIPKGTTVLSSLYHCHHDTDYWDHPEQFNPNHFLSENGEFDGKKPSFIPFSIGKRACIGESIAKMVLFLLTSALLQTFTFAPPKDKECSLEIDETQNVMLFPKHSAISYSIRK